MAENNTNAARPRREGMGGPASGPMGAFGGRKAQRLQRNPEEADPLLGKI